MTEEAQRAVEQAYLAILRKRYPEVVWVKAPDGFRGPPPPGQVVRCLIPPEDSE